MKRQVKAFHETVQQQQQAQQQFQQQQQTAPNAQKQSSPKEKTGDYIDFEEVK